MSLDLLRLVAPPLLGVLAALALDRVAARRGFLPDRFRREPWRRVAAGAVVASVLWLGVFLPLGTWGRAPEIDLEALSFPRLFLLHGLLLLALAAWWSLAYGADLRPLGAQLGLQRREVAREVGLGLGLGAAAWLLVLAAMLTLALAVSSLVGPQALPAEPPPLIPWLAGLPVLARLALSLSAGVVEELFFRGFLQPRMGIALSSGCFVLAHAGYGEPFLLVGVTALSLIYAALVRWRRSLWAAMAAHFLFDAIQLLVVIPALLDAVPGGG